MNFPSAMTICEVGLRDGLQNEKTILTTQQKLELLEEIQQAGVNRIEIGSLVNPKAVPQMADTGELFQLADKKEDIEYRVLVLNQQGIQRAADYGMTKAKLTVSVSETHQKANANLGRMEMFQRFASMAEYAKDHGITLSGALSTAFGCPFEGILPLKELKMVANEFIQIGVTELSLSDTTGMGNPAAVYEYTMAMKEAFPQVTWNLHFHDTRGMGLANVLAGLAAGITRYDASFGGLGGCPFAPGATGNIATEDLLHMCEEMGIHTGVNLDQMIQVAKKVEQMVGHSLSGSILKAGKVSDLHRPSE